MVSKIEVISSNIDRYCQFLKLYLSLGRAILMMDSMFMLVVQLVRYFR